MWRTLLLTVLLMGLSTVAQAQDTPWQACHGAIGPGGPVLSDCRPIQDFVDPQGRELWIRSTIAAPGDTRPRALYVAGVASSEAWLNGQRLGANGRPGATARDERPGRYQAVFPIRETTWRPGQNTLVLHLSSFHGGLRFARPMSAMGVWPYPYPQRIALLAVTFVAAGALLAAAFGFGVIHAMRRTGSSLVLAAMAGVAALQAIVESLRPLFDYPYPLHAWRMSAIWAAGGRLRDPADGLCRRPVPAQGARPDDRPGPGRGRGHGPAAGLRHEDGLGADPGGGAGRPAGRGGRAARPGARPTLAYLALFLAWPSASPNGWPTSPTSCSPPAWCCRCWWSRWCGWAATTGAARPP
jgi:hypothetical protein